MRNFRVEPPYKHGKNRPMKHQQFLTPRAWVELLALACIWGGSFLAFAIALRELDVFTIAAHRVVWAAVLLWIVALIRGWPLPPPRLWFACLVMGILNNVIPFSLIAWGQIRVESGLASIYNSSTAIFGVLFAAIVFTDERLTLRKIIGVTLGFVGVIWALGRESLASIDLRSLSQMAIIAASISYALASLWGRATLKSLDSRSAALGMLTGSALVLIFLTVLVDGLPDVSLKPQTWGAIFYISVPATALAYLLYYRVLAQAGAANLMLVTLLIPPIAIGLGAIALDETLTASALIGMAVIALGLLILDGRILRLLGFSNPARTGIETEKTTKDSAPHDLQDPR